MMDKNSLINNIIPLESGEWQGYVLPFHYISHNYYDVEMNRMGDDFQVSFIKKPYYTPFEYMPDETDKLFQPWWNDIKAWGIIDGGRLIAVIETSAEEWSNRLCVTELWISPSRNMGKEPKRSYALTAFPVSASRDRLCVEHSQSRFLHVRDCGQNDMRA